MIMCDVLANLRARTAVGARGWAVPARATVLADRRAQRVLGEHLARLEHWPRERYIRLPVRHRTRSQRQAPPDDLLGLATQLANK